MASHVRRSFTFGADAPSHLSPRIHTGGRTDSGEDRIRFSTPGGRFPLQVVVTNGAVILEHGQFIERRVQLGPVRILAPAPVRSP